MFDPGKYADQPTSGLFKFWTNTNLQFWDICSILHFQTKPHIQDVFVLDFAFIDYLPFKPHIWLVIQPIVYIYIYPYYKIAQMINDIIKYQ